MEVRGSKVDAVSVIVTKEGIVDSRDSVSGRVDSERKNGSNDRICGQVLEYFKVSGLKGELRILVENGDGEGEWEETLLEYDIAGFVDRLV